MLDEFAYPAVPKTFFYQRTPDKLRLFTGGLGAQAQEIEAVATIRIQSDSEANRLIDALQTAAWTGARNSWEAIARELPDPIVIACNQALDAMPPHYSLALDSNGVPMTVLQESFEHDLESEEFLLMLNAAYDLGQQLLVENYRSDYDGEAAGRLRLLSGETQIFPEDLETVWPTPEQSPLVERKRMGPRELRAVFDDPRWLSNRSRAYWALFISGSREEFEEGIFDATAEWIVEFFEDELPPDPFPEEPEDAQRFILGEWHPWPMTARTRFILWLSLGELQMSLGLGLDLWDEVEGAPEYDLFTEEFPPLVRTQPRSWWETLYNSCQRLVEAMRTGEHWNPQTPGEEALIYIASQSWWIDAAFDSLYETPILERQFESLPEGKLDDDLEEEDLAELQNLAASESDSDFIWDEVPAALAGDEDVALCWSKRLDGITDPTDPTNQAHGMGDYRPDSWHEPFGRYKKEPDFPSSLF